MTDMPDGIIQKTDLTHGNVSVLLKNNIISSVYISTLYDAKNIGSYETLQRLIDSLMKIQERLDKGYVG